MTILRDVLAELFSMFMGDARLTAMILAVVLVTRALIFGAHLPALLGGAVLLAGCVGALIWAVRAEAAARRR